MYGKPVGWRKATMKSAIWLTIVDASATGGVAKYEAICDGKSRMLTAKMIGITPAWLTRSGRKVWPPWYMRRPLTRDAYWMGMRRWPSWMNTIDETTTMAR